MRHEYIEAVDAVRTSWSYWIIYLLPACVIWLSMLFRPFRSYRYRILVVCGAFLLACYLCVDCVWFHANRIQSAKKENMQTTEERQDWTADTWRVFAPVFAIPQSIVFCGMNMVAAGVFRLTINHFHRSMKKDSGQPPITG